MSYFRRRGICINRRAGRFSFVEALMKCRLGDCGDGRALAVHAVRRTDVGAQSTAINHAEMPSVATGRRHQQAVGDQVKASEVVDRPARMPASTATCSRGLLNDSN